MHSKHLRMSVFAIIVPYALVGIHTEAQTSFPPAQFMLFDRGT